MPERYFEDFAPGQTFGSGTVTVETAAIKAFAADFDPQPFHLDEAAAGASLFGGLVASGWHTAALTMRLLVEDGPRPAGGMVGAGVDEIRWVRPTRPGDVLSCTSEVLEVRRSASRRDRGFVKLRTVTVNGRGETVQILVSTLLVPCRPDSE
ncbi:MaoC family dehydratase [Azospirillum sp. ST 5-10]|uniref:MaoC family dehydratase n=1 Tax=unclassified Azospirillum TaxID=2630922 RepID=UPI003F4A56D4